MNLVNSGNGFAVHDDIAINMIIVDNYSLSAVTGLA